MGWEMFFITRLEKGVKMLGLKLFEVTPRMFVTLPLVFGVGWVFHLSSKLTVGL